MNNAQIAKRHCANYVANRDGVSDWCIYGKRCSLFTGGECDYFDRAVLPGVKE